MRKFILPAVIAAAVGLAFLPSHARASWLSEAIHQARGDYNASAYDYDPGYVYTPSDSSYYYSPGYYDYVPPVTYSYSPGYYVSPSYVPYGYGGHSSFGYYPRYHDGWRGGYERGGYERHR